MSVVLRGARSLVDTATANALRGKAKGHEIAFSTRTAYARSGGLV